MDTFANRLAPTRAFIREHLVPLNNIVLLAGSSVAALDFLAPRLSILPKIVFGATGAFSVVLLLAAFTPGLLNRAVAALLRATEGKALRSSPPWQISVVMLALITLMGGVSIAKADSGGLIASSSPTLSAWQSSLLGIEAQTAAIRQGTDQANQKLDSLAGKIASPSFAGDACPTIDCAVGMGASEATLKRFIDQGAALPTEPALFGSSISRLSKSRNPARMGTLTAYLDTRALPDINARAARVAIHEPQELQAVAAQLPADLRPRVAEIFTGRHACGMPSLRLTELAALNGDKELYDWLREHGADPSLPNQWCKDGPFAAPFTAEKLIASAGK